MIRYNGKSYVSDKILSGKCKGIYMKDAKSDVSGKNLAAQCRSVTLGDKCVYGVDYPALEDLLIQYPALEDLLIQYPALEDLLIQYPALGEFIVEDNDMVHSLVETGYTRRLIGDGNSYINTEYIPKFGDEFETNIIAYEYTSIVFGSRNSADGAGSTILVNPDTFGSYFSMNGAMAKWNFAILKGNQYHIIMDKSGIKVNGIEIKSLEQNPTVGGDIRMENPIYLFSSIVAGGALDVRFGKIRMEYFKVNNKAHFIPCFHNNECGMIDLLTGTFYGNANTSGQFTIELTKKE